MAAIERERARVNRYLEAAQTMLIGIDMHRRVDMINRKACEVLQCSESELLGRDWFERVAPEHRQAASSMFRALIEDAPRRAQYFECPVETSRGEHRLIAWRAIAVEDASGVVTEVVWSGDDVTETRRAENELRDARQRIMQVSRLATIGEMASGISHELNQPLAAIANFAQASSRLLCLPDPEIEEVHAALRQIAEQALRAGEIIRRFRNLVHYRKLTLEPLSLNDIVIEIEPLTHADARASGVRVELQLEPQLPPVRADRVQIQQVLLNLVRNSLDAMHALPPAERVVTISTALGQEGNVQLIVADNGPGVPDEMRERLFMPFATSKEQGTGLGLVISRSIVEAHRGRLEYLPNHPRGARFVVTLPADITR
jgi:PAS domain S-box-containing protein